MIPKGEHEICHIGGGTAHNPDYFAAIPNVVYVPRYLAGVTDHLPKIRQFLAGISYRLYGKILLDHIKKRKTKALYGRNGLLSCRAEQPGPEKIEPEDLLTEEDINVWNEGRKVFRHHFLDEATPWELGDGKI